MPVCPKCVRDLPEENFGWKSEKLGRRDAYCRTCRRTYNRAHYKSNKPQYFARNKRAIARLATFIDSLKDKPCMDCGVKYPPCAMDFDHVDASTKVSSLSRLAGNALGSKAVILKEVAKCELVCAVCHRLRTCKRGGHKHRHRS